MLGDLLPTDPDGNKLTYQIVQGPTNGTLTINPNGTYYYKPTNEFAEAGGVDNFIVVADDGQQGQTVVPVNVRVKPTLGVTKSFWFRNYTLAPLRFNGYAGTTGDLDSGPAVGTVILPGGEANWHVTWYMFSSGSITTQFGTVGFGYTPSDFGYVPAGYTGTNFQVAFKTNSRDTQCSAGGGGQCSVPNDRLAIALDKDSPTITLGAAGRGQDRRCASWHLLRQLAGELQLHRDELPDSPVQPGPDSRHPGVEHDLDADDLQHRHRRPSVRVRHRGHQRQAVRRWGGQACVDHQYRNHGHLLHTWVKTNTFTPDDERPGGPRKNRVDRRLGAGVECDRRLTIKIGNSTYQLNGATFTTPNPNEAGSYVIRDKPITSAAD